MTPAEPFAIIDRSLTEVQEDDRPVRFDEMLARSKAMKAVFRQIILAGKADLPALIMGETGTGKDLVAQSIHARSRRHKGPFVAVHLGAIPRDLVGAELFGHERGAFTGAGELRQGRFEMADGGTLFLDELTTMDERTQIALLRVLESGEVARLGGGKPVRCDVRIIAATNGDLAALVAEGRFREDLYYRLDGFPITLPPLRERPGAIRLLCEEFLRVYRDRLELPVRGFEPEALRVLEHYRWPGNVRELKHVIQRAVLLARSGRIGVSHLPVRLIRVGASTLASVAPLGRPMREMMREYAQHTLASVGGNKARAARQLKISRKALYALLANR